MTGTLSKQIFISFFRNPVPMQGLAGQRQESKRETGGSRKAWGCCCRRTRSTAPPADLLQEFPTSLPSCSLPLLHSLPVLQLFSPPAIPSTGPALLHGFHLRTRSGNLEGRTGRKKGHGESEDAGGREGKHFIGFIQGKILFPNGNWKANTIPQFSSTWRRKAKKPGSPMSTTCITSQAKPHFSPT